MIDLDKPPIFDEGRSDCVFAKVPWTSLPLLVPSPGDKGPPGDRQRRMSHHTLTLNVNLFRVYPSRLLANETISAHSSVGMCNGKYVDRPPQKSALCVCVVQTKYMLSAFHSLTRPGPQPSSNASSLCSNFRAQRVECESSTEGSENHTRPRACTVLFLYTRHENPPRKYSTRPSLGKLVPTNIRGLEGPANSKYISRFHGATGS